MLHYGIKFIIIITMMLIMQFYSLQVIATDRGGQGLSTVARLSIKVEDINDNAPTFSRLAPIYLEHSMKKGTIIGRVHAQDLDLSSPNNNVIYVLISGGYGKFGVNFESGI